MPKFPLTALATALTLFLGAIAFGLTTADADPVRMKAVAGQSVGKPVDVPVAPRGFPVVITGTQFTPAQPKAGGRVSLRVALHNTSKQPVEAFAVALQLNTKKRFPAGMTQRARSPVRGLKPGQRTAVGFTVQLPPAVVATKPTRVAYRVTIVPVSGRYLPGTKQKKGAQRLVSVSMPGQQPVLSSKRPEPSRLKGQTAPVTAMGAQPVPVKGGTRRPRLQFLVVDGKLDVNGSAGPVTITVGGTATVNWKTITTLPSPPPVTPTGVHLLVHNAPMPADNCAQTPPATGSPDSGYKPGAPGGAHTLSLTNPYYVPGTTYYVKGCIFNQDMLGVRTYTGFETNTVGVRYEAVVQKPDLTVSDMHLEGNRVVFTVKNSGNGVKLPTSANLGGLPPRIKYKPIQYEIRTVKTLSRNPLRLQVGTFKGKSEALGKAILAPGQTMTLKHNINVSLTPDHRVHVCINQPRIDFESNYLNNCLTKTVSDLERTSYDVNVAIVNIEVHDDGDNVSPGDWNIAFAKARATRDEVHVASNPQQVNWPSVNGTRNVSSGSSFNPRLVLRFTNVKANETLALIGLVIDCDGGLIPGLSPIVEGIYHAFANNNCPGEEVWETSGSHEFMSLYPLEFTPAEWLQNGNIIKRRYNADGLDATFHFKLYGSY